MVLFVRRCSCGPARVRGTCPAIPESRVLRQPARRPSVYRKLISALQRCLNGEIAYSVGRSRGKIFDGIQLARHARRSWMAGRTRTARNGGGGARRCRGRAALSSRDDARPQDVGADDLPRSARPGVRTARLPPRAGHPSGCVCPAIPAILLYMWCETCGANSARMRPIPIPVSSITARGRTGLHQNRGEADHRHPVPSLSLATRRSSGLATLRTARTESIWLASATWRFSMVRRAVPILATTGSASARLRCSAEVAASNATLRVSSQGRLLLGRVDLRGERRYEPMCTNV